VLAEWGPPSLVPVFRQALLQTWRKEQDPQELPHSTSRWFYEALCYALGRRGVLGALHGIWLPGPLRRQALRFLVLGYLNLPERFNSNALHSFFWEKEVRDEVSAVLMECFGLAHQEVQQVLDTHLEDSNRLDYWWDYRAELKNDLPDEDPEDETLRLAAELARASRQHQEPPDQSSETAQP
jgi:hypothetical protein